MGIKIINFYLDCCDLLIIHDSKGVHFGVPLLIDIKYSVKYVGNQNIEGTQLLNVI